MCWDGLPHATVLLVKSADDKYVHILGTTVSILSLQWIKSSSERELLEKEEKVCE